MKSVLKSAIIQRAEKKILEETIPFDRLMMKYRCALREVQTKLEVLNEDFSVRHNRNPVESIKTRIKSPHSIIKKMQKKELKFTADNIENNITDIAGVRVICSFVDDIYEMARLLSEQDDIEVVEINDYIKQPKESGYRSLHLVVQIPIFLSEGKEYMKVEVQIRTIAMDFWASLEHKLRYKKEIENSEAIGERLKKCAEEIEKLDLEMQEIREEIELE